MTEDSIKGHCPECGPDRFADIVGHHKERLDDDEIGIWSVTDHRILRCRGCMTAYFQRDSVFSEDIDYKETATGEWQPYLPHKINYYPSPVKRAMPEWSMGLNILDDALGDLFTDVYGALNADLRVPAAVAIRTVFDRASEILGVDPAVTFAEKLQALADQGKIGADEKSSLDVLADAGGAAAHRGWKPKPRELDTLVLLIEAFLHRTFILGDAAKELKARLPPKPKRQPKPAAGPVLNRPNLPPNTESVGLQKI